MPSPISPTKAGCAGNNKGGRSIRCSWANKYNKDMNTIKLKLGLLKKFREFNRNEDQVHPLLGGCTNVVLKVIEKDLKNGIGIKNPVELTIDVESKEALLEEGNHRITACINAGMNDNFEIPVILKLLRGRMFMKKSKSDKFKQI